MVKLLILADDFTGALDTGVQFSGKGIRTQVVVSSHWVEPDSDCDVMVIDVETRHVPKEKAYEIVYDVCQQAVKYGIRCFYKKTDSGYHCTITYYEPGKFGRMYFSTQMV